MRLLTFLLLAFSVQAQEFKNYTIRIPSGGEVAIRSYVTPGTETTRKAILYGTGIAEHPSRYDDIIKLYPQYNHYVYANPFQGKYDHQTVIRDGVGRIHGNNSQTNIRNLVIPTVIDHVYRETGGQKMTVATYSMSAKNMHDALVEQPALREKVDSLINFMRPNFLGKDLYMTKKEKELLYKILKRIDRIPVKADHEFVAKILAGVFPAAPDRLYVHLDGTTLKNLATYARDGMALHIGGHVFNDFLKIMIEAKFEHRDHGLPLAFVWADNDMLTPGGAQAWEEMVKIRVENYLSAQEEYHLLSPSQRAERFHQVYRDVINRKFPPNFTPMYGISFGNVGHLGPMIPGSESFTEVSKIVQQMRENPKTFTFPSLYKFKKSPANLLSCPVDFFDSIFKRRGNKSLP